MPRLRSSTRRNSSHVWAVVMSRTAVGKRAASGMAPILTNAVRAGKPGGARKMDDKTQRDETRESAKVDPAHPPGTDSSIQVGPDPTDPKRTRGRAAEDDPDGPERDG